MLFVDSGTVNAVITFGVYSSEARRRQPNANRMVPGWEVAGAVSQPHLGRARSHQKSEKKIRSPVPHCVLKNTARHVVQGFHRVRQSPPRCRHHAGTALRGDFGLNLRGV